MKKLIIAAAFMFTTGIVATIGKTNTTHDKNVTATCDDKNVTATCDDKNVTATCD